MWDNPRLLNAAAGFLVGLVALALAFTGLHWLLRAAPFPVRMVELRTPLKQAPHAEVEAALARHGAGNFFAVSLDELRADRLEVTIEEHVALAHWGADALVNTHGERFAATSDEPLPLFIGPPGSEAEVTRRYARFSRLLAPLGSPLERIALSPRHAWQLKLASGLQIALGRDADLAEQRLQRFVDAYAGVTDAGRRTPQVVDLRYPNGFAVRVKG